MRLKGFHIRINGGPKQFFPVKTTIYRDAAAAVPAIYGRRLPVDVEIWSEDLVPEYGPYHYRIRENEFGGIVVEHLLPQPNAAGQASG